MNPVRTQCIHRSRIFYPRNAIEAPMQWKMRIIASSTTLQCTSCPISSNMIDLPMRLQPVKDGLVTQVLTQSGLPSSSLRDVIVAGRRPPSCLQVNRLSTARCHTGLPYSPLPPSVSIREQMPIKTPQRSAMPYCSDHPVYEGPIAGNAPAVRFS